MADWGSVAGWWAALLVAAFRGTRREPIPGGLSSASMPQTVPRKAATSSAFASTFLLLLAIPFSAATDEAEQGEMGQEKAEQLVERGRYLAIAGDCAACHTSDKTHPFAGGYPMPVPLLGTVYSTNITPHKTLGIGAWTLEEFEGALRRGVGKGGRNLYPAMPYVSYAKITDEDVRALYAYFMHGVEPVAARNRDNDIPVLLSPRWPLKLWNGMFLQEGAFQSDPEKSEAWNRGAYLVQGPAHCGTCHTPRGIGFQEKSLTEKGGHYLAGGPVMAGWQAYNITPHENDGIGLWSERELIRFLKTGHVNRLAQAGGPMAEAVEKSLSRFTDEDIRAIATYLRDIPAVSGEGGGPRQLKGQAAQDVAILRGKALASGIGEGADGARLYLGLCASCHGADGTGSEDGYYPSLVHNSTVGAHSDHNLRQAIKQGVKRDIGEDEILMPGFAGQLDKRQMDALVSYLRRQFGSRPGEDAPDTAVP